MQSGALLTKKNADSLQMIRNINRFPVGRFFRLHCVKPEEIVRILHLLSGYSLLSEAKTVPIPHLFPKYRFPLSRYG